MVRQDIAVRGQGIISGQHPSLTSLAMLLLTDWHHSWTTWWSLWTSQISLHRMFENVSVPCSYPSVMNVLKIFTEDTSYKNVTLTNWSSINKTGKISLTLAASQALPLRYIPGFFFLNFVFKKKTNSILSAVRKGTKTFLFKMSFVILCGWFKAVIYAEFDMKSVRNVPLLMNITPTCYKQRHWLTESKRSVAPVGEGGGAAWKFWSFSKKKR